MTETPPRLLRPPPAVAAVAFAKLGLLLWCAAAYGYTGRELYALACTNHPAWGYVGSPPLSVAVLLAGSRLYGETILSIRFIPALTAALSVMMTARLARRFGASVRGQLLAALSMLLAPALLMQDHVYSAASLDVLLWMVSCGVLCRAVTADPDSGAMPWVRVGVMGGLAALTDLAAIPFGGALLLGIVATGSRVWLRRMGPWLALSVSLAMLAPYLVWEQTRGWPTLAVLSRAFHQRAESRAWLLPRQAWSMLPANLMVWGAGLVALFRVPSLAPYRFIGVAFAALAGVAVIAGSSSLLVPAYPILFAAGGAALDGWLGARRWRLPVLFSLIALNGVVALPLALPLLRVHKYERYARALGVAPPAPDLEEPPLPPHFAEMFGWPELVRAVGNVADALPPLDREEALVLAGNVYEAGALTALGPALGLPKVISGDGSFYFWGTRGASGNVVIAVGVPEALLKSHFSAVESVMVVGHSLALPQERHLRIFVCKDPVAPLESVWHDFKTVD
jgi:Dolichyl-phosphate-mannose-protein mannosyltransferase